MGINMQHYIEHFRNTFDGEPSCCKSLMTVLNEMDIGQAYQKSSSTSHSIYEILLHLLAWRELFVKRLNGDTSSNIEMDSQQDWPPQPDDHSRDNWDKLIKRLYANQQTLIDTLQKIPDEKLDKPLVKNSPVYEHLESYLHHDIYHIGQVALLKNIFKPKSAGVTHNEKYE